jgi:hypothetical protein
VILDSLYVAKEWSQSMRVQYNTNEMRDAKQHNSAVLQGAGSVLVRRLASPAACMSMWEDIAYWLPRRACTHVRVDA